MSSDKRQSNRVSTDVRGSWHRGSVHCLTQVANLSTGGCFIESLDQTPPSGQFRLRLQLPRNELVWLTGEVAHFQLNQGFGVRFLQVSESSRRMLSRAVDALRGPFPAGPTGGPGAGPGAGPQLAN